MEKGREGMGLGASFNLVSWDGFRPKGNVRTEVDRGAWNSKAHGKSGIVHGNWPKGFQSLHAQNNEGATNG